MKKCIIFMLHILISCPLASLAIYNNVNEVTNLFDQNIEDKRGLLENLEGQNNNAINQIKSGDHHDSIEGTKDAKQKQNELVGIKETQLDNAGRAKRASQEYQFYDENELEPDYTKPGNRLHKEDGEDIVSGTNEMMRKIGTDFMAKLNSEGFDCKTVKGSIEKEPTYHIEIKREEQKNTEYDQFFCEELRNTYDCNDSLTLRCAQRGIEWGHWQHREMLISGSDIFNHHNNWLYVVRPKKGFWLMHVACSDGCVKDQLRHHIAGLLCVGIDHIEPNVEIGSSGEGNIYRIRDKCRVWDNYRVKYKYRDSKPICVKWDGDDNGWNERCYLK